MALAVIEFQQLLTGLTNELSGDVVQLLSRLGRLDQEELLAFITDAYPDLLQPYIAAAADATVTWYEEQPAKKKTFTPTPAEAPPLKELAIAGRWAMLQGNPITAMQGTATRSVFSASRDTVITNTLRENVRWARHASAGACGFCKILATRGAVYRSQQSAKKSHNHCHCLAVPDRDGTFEPAPYVAQWEKDYVQARRDGANTIGKIAYAMDKLAA